MIGYKNFGILEAITLIPSKALYQNQQYVAPRISVLIKRLCMFGKIHGRFSPISCIYYYYYFLKVKNDHLHLHFHLQPQFKKELFHILHIIIIIIIIIIICLLVFKKGRINNSLKCYLCIIFKGNRVNTKLKYIL